MEDFLRERIGSIRDKIAAAAGRAGRKEEEISLMAVTKTHGRGLVLEAYGAGIRIFGENRTAEAAEKYTGMPEDIILHLIGHLQTNKAKSAAGLFSWVDSIDSYHTAAALDLRLGELDRKADILLEINTSGEASKSGYSNFEALLKELEPIIALPRLRLRGLLTIGPLTGDEKSVRDSFRLLRNCFVKLQNITGGGAVDTLSMGMSSDYEIAVEEGATLLRLGTALFGGRPA